MTTTSGHVGSHALPAFPGKRPVHCPFDPPQEYADWRRRPGLGRVRLWNNSTPWVVTRYQDIRHALTDPRLSADIHRPGMPMIRPGSEPVTGQATGFVRMDDPNHARLRRMVIKDFAARRVEELRPRIQNMVDDTLDNMINKGGPADLVVDFALPVASAVICLLLGVPYDDHQFFQGQTAVINSLVSSTDTAKAARLSLLNHLRRLLTEKEREPGDDMISRLLVEQVAKGKLSHDELTVMIRMMLSTGHETVANTLALGVLALLRHPDQFERVRDTDDADVIGNAADELLRYTSAAENPVIRVAMEDMVVGGQLVRHGDGLIISPLSGNRDPAFVSDPDTLDVGRDARDHLTFGLGIHQCPGQRLARLEIQLALSALLTRLPTLRLAISFEQVRFKTDTAVVGVHELPVLW